MPQYQYKAMNTEGRLIPGGLEAADPQELEQRLKQMGMDLVSCKQMKGQSSHTLRGGKLSRRDLITFCLHMEQLTRAGVPLMDTLEDLRDAASNPRMQSILATVVSDIEGGKKLSEALSEHPRTFDRVFVSLVRAGEETGRLSDVFKNLADSIKWVDEIIAQTRKAVSYPAFVLLVVGGVMSFMMIYLVPQLQTFITEFGEGMPLHTRALIATSNAFVDYWYLIFGLPVLASISYVFLYKSSPTFRFRADYMKLKLWVIGPILEKIVLARFANYFALTYNAGLQITDSLRICEEVMGNEYLSHGVSEARRFLTEGQGISQSFESVNMFPSLVLRMIKVGETTGALDDALLNVSYFYDREVKEGIDRLQSMIEPALTLIMASLILWIMMAIFGPIYDTIGNIKL
ncbi:MAG: type II secretion system F family protein [Gammaproteobacteria bacterium]|nr:MAG: type II secretion system F family protein [Gammaproteobacteria bacterium]